MAPVGESLRRRASWAKGRSKSYTATAAFVAFSTADPVEHWQVLIGEILLELTIGAAIGLAVGWLGSWGLRHVALPASGLYPIAVMAIQAGEPRYIWIAKSS